MAKTPPSLPLSRVKANNSLLNLFSDYLPLTLQWLDPKDPSTWYALVPPVGGLHPVQFEIYFKALKSRNAFHARQVKAVLKARKPMEASHRGVSDLFSPAGPGVLICGPFLQELPPPQALRSQFAGLKGAAPASEELLLSYARSVAETPVLSPRARQALRQACAFAASWLLEGRGRDARELEELKPLFARAVPARMEHFAESHRERLLLWASQAKGLAPWDRRDFGIAQMPGAVMAFSLASTPKDALEGIVQAAKLRRLAFELAVEKKLVFGRSAGEGACLMAPSDKSLESLARSIQSRLAEGLGLPVALGLSRPLSASQLPEAFRQAEWALLMALQQGERFLKYSGAESGGSAALAAWKAGRSLKSALLSGNHAGLSGARDAALGSMARLFPGRADLLRPQLLQLTLELLDAVQARGLLEGPSWEGLRREALESLEGAGTARALAGEFSGIVDRLEQSSVAPRSGGAKSRLKNARRLLEENAPFTDLAHLASQSALSSSRFSRLYKESSGEGFAVARRRKRLDQAALLLRQGEMPVWRVAQECGYKSPSHFTQAFQGQFGSTPAQFRKINR